MIRKLGGFMAVVGLFILLGSVGTSDYETSVDPRGAHPFLHVAAVYVAGFILFFVGMELSSWFEG